ncbi:MAG: DinB family protein [Flavobacteriales bacterium]|nr:DinB family protein [Flavobacteriales bacterium]
MNKEEIIFKLDSTHSELNTLLHSLDEDEMKRSLDRKWSVIEHVVHLSKALSPLHKGLKRSKFLIRYSFGRPNRIPRDYDTVKERYYAKLADVPPGVTSPFVPKEGDDLSKEITLSLFESNQQALANSLRKWKEHQLDKYILPHPLLGKVTVKEMLFFMDFHTQHHLEIIRSLTKQL